MKKVFAFTLLLSTVLVVCSCTIQQHHNTLPASIFITNAPSAYRTVNGSNPMAPVSYTSASPLVTFTAVKSRYVTRLCWRRYPTSNGFVFCAETSQRLLSGLRFQRTGTLQNNIVCNPIARAQ